MTTELVYDDRELIAALNRLGNRLDEALEDVALAGGEVLAAAMDRRAPGRRGIVTETLAKSQGAVTVGVGPHRRRFYFGFFETGVQRHEITPFVRQALHSSGLLGSGFAARANHPGFAARPFMRPAIDGERDSVARAMQREATRIMWEAV